MSGGSATGKIQMQASIALVLGGVFWGIFWIPLRGIGEAGIKGAWAGLFVYICVALGLLIVLALKSGRGLIHSPWHSLIWCGLFTGTAITLYSVSIFLTDVVRVLLLFYMTPVWSTLMGLILLGEKITLRRSLSLILGLAGMAVILGIGTQFPWPKNLGDWLAIISGIAWAYGSLCIYQLERSGTFEQVFIFVLGSIAVSVVAVIFGNAALSPPISINALYDAIPMILISAVLLIPMLFLTLWPASLLSPARVGLLLMSEVVIGVLSAAWLAGEPFGTREIIGSLLIIGAGFVEVLGPTAVTRSEAETVVPDGES